MNLSTAQQTVLTNRVNEIFGDKNTNLTLLCQNLKISKPTLYRVKNEEWDKLSDAKLTEIRYKLGLMQWQIRNTPNFYTIQQLCQRAMQRKEFYAVAAETGFGKTTALKYFANQHTKCWYVRVRKFENFRQLTGRILKAINYQRGSTTAERIRMVGRRLKETGGMLILDDVHKMTDAGYHLLYDIYEQLEGEVALVIAGTEHLKLKIDRKCRLDSEGFRELNRRIVYWEKLRNLEPKEVKKIVAEYGITDRNAQQFIVQRATNYGILHNMVTTALEVSNRESVAIDRELLADLQLGDQNF